MVVSPRQFSQSLWREVFKKVQDAVVFVDSEAAECLHWNGGIIPVLSSGAIAVKEFSSFEKGDEKHKKAVFITASPHLATTRVILRDLIQNSKFNHCILVTASHPSVHNLSKYGAVRDSADEMAIFHRLEEDMLHWMGNLNYAVEIFYFPLFLACITDNFFVTPPFRHIFPLLEDDIPDIQKLNKQLKGTNDRTAPETLSHLDFGSLPLDLQVNLQQLACSLHSWFAHLDVREDVFVLGPTSGLLASALENLPAAINRRKSAAGRCSVLLVDRSLDLASACSHGFESFLDRITSTLPHLQGHSTDVAVNMSLVSSANVSLAVNDITLAPGCLSHETEHCKQVLEWLVSKRQKDVLLNLHKLLLTIVPTGSDEQVTRVNTRVTSNILEKQVSAFKGKVEALVENCGVLEQTLGVTQTLKSPIITQFEQIWSVEKLMFLSLNGTQNAANVQEQVRRLIESRQERGFHLLQLFALLVYVYSLAGPNTPFCPDEERELHMALHWALKGESESCESSILQQLVPEGADKDQIDQIADKVINRLRSIARARKDLSTYRSLLNVPSGDLQEATHTGLLQRLISDLVNPSHPEIADLTCRSSGLKELLKSGFSMLLNRPRQQHPFDNPLVIIFVLGGITAHEAHTIQAATEGSDVRILVGGTCLASASSMVEAVFVHKLF